jgi:hypothetical protein
MFGSVVTLYDMQVPVHFDAVVVVKLVNMLVNVLRAEVAPE